MAGLAVTSAFVSVNSFRNGDIRSAVLMVGFSGGCLGMFVFFRVLAGIAQVRRGRLTLFRLLFEGVLWVCWVGYFLQGWWRPVTNYMGLVEVLLLLFVVLSFNSGLSGSVSANLSKRIRG